MNSKTHCGLLALSSLSAANADVLGKWTSNVANTLKSSSVPAGAMVSSLAINPSHDTAGVEAVPNTFSDGNGFGGPTGEFAIFLSRAGYFNSTPDTDNGGDRPVGRVTTWASLDTTKPHFPSSSLRRLLRRGYEGQEGYDQQAGPTQWLFQGSPAES